MTNSNDDATPAAVAVLIRRADGRRLMIQRAATLRAAGYWTPVTGKVHPDEALEDAARREVREEIGAEIALGEPFFECPTHDRRYRLIWYDATLKRGGSPAPNPAEVAALRWVDGIELTTLSPVFPATEEGFAASLRRFP